jgi:hypothetical protein
MIRESSAREDVEFYRPASSKALIPPCAEISVSCLRRIFAHNRPCFLLQADLRIEGGRVYGVSVR